MRKPKSIILGIIYRIAVRLPPRFGALLINRTLNGDTLDYLEFHLADHCNLNCAGCFHFSPFADHHLADLKSVRRDFAALKTKFRNIRHIRIMGGEPFLHPQLVEFARVVRSTFPCSRIRVVTNGVLISYKEHKEELRELAELGVGIDWTKYPPLADKEPQIAALCREAGIHLRISENNAFMARLLPKGGEGPLKSFRWCREHMYCPILKEGRIYLCAQTCYAEYYNRVAGVKMFADRGIELASASGREILEYLMHPSLACTHCAASARIFPWKPCSGPEDWVL